MAISRSELYSIGLKRKVIEAECQLWQRFNALHSGNISSNETDNIAGWSFYPNHRESFKYGNTVEKHSGEALENDTYLKSRSYLESKGYWENKIVCYSLTNRQDYLPLLQRLTLEMQRQNEEFSEVLPQSDRSTKELTLKAIHQLELQDKQLGYALRRFIGRILIVESEQLVAFSSMLSLGLVVIAPKSGWSLYDYMEQLIHEMSHIELYLKQLTDPLVIKGRYLSSPFRQQLRPVNAVFHSIFVLARILIYLKPIVKDQADNLILYSRLNHCQQVLEKSLQSFYQSSLLTSAGELLFKEINSVHVRG